MLYYNRGRSGHTRPPRTAQQPSPSCRRSHGDGRPASKIYHRQTHAPPTSVTSLVAPRMHAGSRVSAAARPSVGLPSAFGLPFEDRGPLRLLDRTRTVDRTRAAAVGVEPPAAGIVGVERGWGVLGEWSPRVGSAEHRTRSRAGTVHSPCAASTSPKTVNEAPLCEAPL